MNILEAYIKKFKQLIILILGLPCSNKSDIAKELQSDIGFKLININDYFKSEEFKEIVVDHIKFKLYDDPDNIDWDKLNKDINEAKTDGVIIYGNYLIKEKIDWDFDYSFFYSMNTTMCKKKLIEKKLFDLDETDDKTKIFFEKIFNPFYENIKSNIKVNKFFNIKEDTDLDELYDETFDLLMDLVQKKLSHNDNNKINKTDKKYEK